jgi:hypothetical protein
MAAIERLMAREVESRVIAGFEPGHHGTRPASEERHERGNGHRRPQNQNNSQRQRPQRDGRPQGDAQRRPQSDGQRRPQSDGQRRPQSDGQRRPQPDGQRRPNGSPRPFGQSPRPQGRPHHAGRHQAPARLPANIVAEQSAQLAEARARMAAEGEKPAAPAPKRSRYEPELGALLRDKTDKS